MAGSMFKKQDWVIGAIYRLFASKKIDQASAVKLLTDRANINQKAAVQTATIWARYA
jgi:hypothetical protein